MRITLNAEIVYFDDLKKIEREGKIPIFRGNSYFFYFHWLRYRFVSSTFYLRLSTHSQTVYTQNSNPIRRSIVFLIISIHTALFQPKAIS